jgi:thioredoxin reductase
MRDTVIEVKKFEDHLVVETANNGTLHTVTVIVATGARPVWLDIPGAEEMTGYGLGYSVTTHAALLRRKRVAILGLTVRSLRGAAEIASSAERIYLVANDPSEVDTPLAQVLKRWPHVEILSGYTPKEVLGETWVEGLLLQKDDTVRRLDVDAVFVDYGLVPQSHMVQNLVQTDPDGFVWVDDRNMTTQPGVFAAGDVCVAFGEQVLIAIGDGARAALSAYDYILARRLARLQKMKVEDKEEEAEEVVA